MVSAKAMLLPGLIDDAAASTTFALSLSWAASSKLSARRLSDKDSLALNAAYGVVPFVFGFFT
jgi:hypothetical protein